MTWQEVVSDWPLMRIKLRERWGRLSMADLRSVSGDKYRLIGLVIDRYGYDPATATRELDDFCRSSSTPPSRFATGIAPDLSLPASSAATPVNLN